jgi:uncharacterized protein
VSDKDNLVLVEVRGLMNDPATRTPIVVLRDDAGDRFLPIWIGLFEAQAIGLAIEGVRPPRPMTHDLLANLLTSLGGIVDRVVVSSLREGTFYATVEVLRGDEALALDARPSDAIALALRLGSPILVHEGVFSEAEVRPPAQGEPLPFDEEERSRRVLESLTPEELGKYKM